MTLPDSAQTFADRIFQSVLGTMDVLSIYLGERLGFYSALASGGALTPGQLASATGCDPRYVREWLEQQAVTAILQVDDVGAAAGERRYTLPAAALDVLAHSESLDYMASVVRVLVSMARPLPELLTAYRRGGGVPWSSYGVDAREGQADVNKPIFLELIGEWFARVPDLDARMRREPPARVADVGTGAGWSSIAIARHYPLVQVEGIDVDMPSIALANANLIGTGLADRVLFRALDAGDPALGGRFDIVTLFEALHDMSQPVVVLKKMRSLLAPDGIVAIIDERVAEHFTAPGDEIERMMYGWSVLCCLAIGKSESPSAETGTVLRSDIVRKYALEAGFNRFESVELDHPFFRMYLVRP